jgi:hypothetical protein
MTNTTLSSLCIVALATAGASVAQTSAPLSAADESAIRALGASYSSTLAACRAEDYADLFVPETGYFASGFRGRMVGRDELIALVKSERHCLAPAASAPAARPGGASPPAVVLEATGNGARGVTTLGAAEYQDEYAKTPGGWRFASRTVILEAEKAAGIAAQDLLAIERLSGAALGDFYEAGENGARGRLLTSGVRVSVADGEVKGRAFLKSGGYYDDVYEKLPSGEWRVKTRVHVPDGGR